MPLTVAQIAAKALDKAGAAITDAVHAASLSYRTNGAYNAATGAYAVTVTTITGRAVLASTTPIADIFPDYVVGPADQLYLLEGFSAAPAEGWTLTVGGVARSVTRTQDIAAAGTLFYAVARG